MPTSCSAYGCTERHDKGSELSFFRFPLKKEEELKKWIHAVKRKGFTPKLGDRLCSLHFQNDDFILSPGIGRKVLKPGVVPSVFTAFPTHLQPKKKYVRKPQNNIVQEEISVVKNFVETTNNSVRMVETQTDDTIVQELNNLRRATKLLSHRVQRLEKNTTRLNLQLKSIQNKKKEENTCKKLFKGKYLPSRRYR